MELEFVETSYFTRHITELFSDDEYRLLQNELIENTEKGKYKKNAQSDLTDVQRKKLGILVEEFENER